MDDKRYIILQAALQVFRQHGYDKVALNDVAKHAGKARTSLYKYFRNKEDLFKAAMEYNSAPFFREINMMALSDLPAIKKMKRYNNAKFSFIKTVQKENALVNKDVACNPKLREIIMDTNGKEEINVLFKIILSGSKSGEFKLITGKEAKLTATVFFSMTAAIIYEFFEQNDLKNFLSTYHITEKMFVNSLIK